MAEHVTPHEGLTEYVLDVLPARERESFERHLRGCASCRAQVAELRGVAALLARAVPGYDVPPGLEGRTFAAVERAAAPVPSRRWPWARRLVLAGAAAAALAAGVAVGSLVDRPGGAGQVELEAVLAPPGSGGSFATARVTKTGIGRVVAFRTAALPTLPQGEYYELWFVGPGDTLAAPNRISAGTFHPDESGRSDVELTAAVDPARYPVLSVTAEPGDGNPRRTGPELLRSREGGER